MKKEDIIIGDILLYQPIIGSNKGARKVEVKSEAFEMGGSTVCFVKGVFGCVDIENLCKCYDKVF